MRTAVIRLGSVLLENARDSEIERALKALADDPAVATGARPDIQDVLARKLELYLVNLTARASQQLIREQLEARPDAPAVSANSMSTG